MSQVSVIAKLTAQEGQRDALAAALQVALDAVIDEPGTLHYTLHADTSDAEVLWMFELYTGSEALQAHMGADWFKALGPSLAPLLGGRPELRFMTPIGGKGL